jgi:hypothetical protein
MRLAIVAEKPSLLDAFAPLLPEFFPQTDFTRTPVFYPISGWYVGSAKRFRLPRGLKWSDLPFISPTSYKRISFSEARAQMGVRKLVGKPSSMTEADAEQAFAEADVILALGDASYGGAHLAHRFISDALGYFPNDRVLFPIVWNVSERELRKALSEMRLFENFALPWVEQGEIRRYFDYNFLSNAIPILGAAAREAMLLGGFVPSKYSLQLLYDVRDTGQMSDGQRISRMYSWKGTGKYKTEDDFYGLGSPTSQHQLILELESAGALERVNRIETLITKAGMRFLDLLHPDCRDPDLPIRLHQWSRMPGLEARQKIDRYICTFFGKQKKFFAKAQNSTSA